MKLKVIEKIRQIHPPSYDIARENIELVLPFPYLRSLMMNESEEVKGRVLGRTRVYCALSEE